MGSFGLSVKQDSAQRRRRVEDFQEKLNPRDRKRIIEAWSCTLSLSDQLGLEVIQWYLVGQVA